MEFAESIVIHLNFREKRSWMDGRQIQFKKIIYPRDFWRITSKKQTNKQNQNTFSNLVGVARDQALLTMPTIEAKAERNQLLASLKCNFVHSQMNFSILLKQQIFI